MNRVAIAIVVFILWTAGAFGAGWAWRGDRAEASEATTQRDTAQAETAAQVDARQTEHASAQTLADIGAQHEEDRTDAETVPAAVAADLRAGQLRLRKQWAACETQLLSSAAAATLERDALAELRAADQGNLVRIGRDADDQLRACQAVVLADREGHAP